MDWREAEGKIVSQSVRSRDEAVPQVTEARLSLWDVVYALNMAMACLVSYWIMLTLRIPGRVKVPRGDVQHQIHTASHKLNLAAAKWHKQGTRSACCADVDRRGVEPMRHLD